MATPIPSNQAHFSAEELLRISTGRLLSGALPVSVEGVCTDTRTLRSGELFVALKGASYDAHDHLQQAVAAGAAVALVEHPVEAVPGLPLIQVSSTLAALGAFAAHHLRQWRQRDDHRRVIAITGSAGKTTSKEAIAALLRQVVGDGVHVSAGNLNNLIGVPMTLLGLSESHRYAVLELGTNAPGEIAQLAAMAQPDVALVTLIAHAHTLGLGSLDAVAEEKLALFAALDDASGIAIGNFDDCRIQAAVLRQPGRAVSYGHASEQAEPSYSIRESHLTDEIANHIELVLPGGERLTFETDLLGRAGALACAAAVATVNELGIAKLSDVTLRTALGGLRPGGRLELTRAGDGLLVIDDSYNANPASMRASIELAAELARQSQRRLVLVLGEMRELGECSVIQHRELGEVVASAGAEFIIAIAGHAEHLADTVQERGGIAHFVVNVADATRLACEFVERQDVVLVKGSRGICTERVVEALLEQHERHTLPGGLPNHCGTLAP